MGALRALVVDDHPMCRQAATFALLAAFKGCSVIEAANLADAIGMAEDANIILLDLGMPDGHGIAGLLQIISVAPKAGVIAVTGNEALGLPPAPRPGQPPGPIPPAPRPQAPCPTSFGWSASGPRPEGWRRCAT